ncbi:MAG: hypothetical protein ACHQHN_05700 [Sphingobacteriales bacterium]
MNIDELKDAWGQDEPKGMSLPLSTEMLGKTNSVIKTIRKKMRAEFIALVVCYAVMIGFLFSSYQSSIFTDMIKILLFAILLLNGFYYSRFYIFYKAIGRYDLNMKSSLRKIVYELELNTEIYKTYSFSAMPLSVLAAGAFIVGKFNFIHMPNLFTHGNSVPGNMMLWICLTILVSYVITYFLISLAVHVTYGKYIDELKQVMNDLGEDI